jgi:phosphoribosylformylglycinamidine synthase
MAEACTALGIPVVGGNVSLYNESGGTDIDPTPVVAVLGVIDDLTRTPPGPALVAGTSIVLVGSTDGSLAGSRWAVERRGHHGGVLAAPDLVAHGRFLRLVAGLAGRAGLIAGIHDVSSGGLGVALAECAVGGAVGFAVDGVDGHGELFTESPGRVVVCSARPDELIALCDAAGVPARVLGQAGGDRLVVDGLLDVALDDALASWRRALPDALGVPAG